MVKAFAAAFIVAASVFFPAYDAFGELEEGLTAKKTLRPDGTVQKVEVTDRHGRKVYEAFYGPDGKLAMNPVDNWAARKWVYDGANLVKEKIYGDDGRVKETKEFNRSGDLIRKKYFGGEKNIDEYEEYGTRTFPYGTVEMYK
ncbi:MAG TPA: hypothetical protein PLV09_01440 [Candidatus Omnitrophota bacterium]|nr:hypothetical protein [Candidatus Omnitrophota bacterium]MDD5737252.1 hypothetical protein [Candidatus Omnitrophota bacterium]HOX09202.1 hypothetical protein [Candidatus Omnitrophota bacterium]HPN66064.1 hypothetical protein [Candidatus Omnitrophota bacterium]